MKCLIYLHLLFLTACGTTYSGTVGDYQSTCLECEYYRAQAARATQPQQPILRLIAQEGQPITGLASIEVYSPDQKNSGQIQQYQNQWVSAFQTVATAALPLALGQLGSYYTVKAVGDIATQGFTSLNVAGDQAVQVSEQGFAAIGDQSASQAASLAAVQGTAQAGIAGVQDTAAAGLTAVQGTATAGINATQQTGQAGINAVQATAEAGFAMSLEALQSLNTAPVTEGL